MKILAISHTYVVDLNQQVIGELAKRYPVNVEMIAPESWKGEYGIQNFRALAGLGFPVRHLPVLLSGQISLYTFRGRLKTWMRKFRPDIVFLHAEPWSLVALQVSSFCRRRQIPLVVFTNQNLLKKYPPPFSWIEQHTYKVATAIAVLSEECRQVLRAKGYTKDTPELVYPCDLELFFPGKEIELRQKIGVSGTVVGYIGRLVKEKGLDNLIEAALQLMAQSPELNFTVLLVGSGDQEEVLKQTIAQSNFANRFIFAGSVLHKDAPRYMRCFDIMVLPSRTTPAWKEQFGRVIIESLSCKIPVIGSDSGHIPYLIRETEGGSVFSEGDSKDLANKLQALLEDAQLRQTMGEKGHVVVHKRYSQEAVANQLYRILENSLNTTAAVIV